MPSDVKISIAEFTRGIAIDKRVYDEWQRKFIQPQEDPMMKFVIHSDEQKTGIALEQAVDDVIVRADGMGVATFKAQNGMLRVSRQGLQERGITLVVEELPIPGE